jgi:hypothetical protein
MIKYRSGYKYQLAEGKIFKVGYRNQPIDDRTDSFLNLDAQGNLTIYKGYAWDGASGIPDTRWNITASLVHDALYQLLRNGALKNREIADKEYRAQCIRAGMYKWIANMEYWVLRKVAAKAASTDSRKKILMAR